MSVIHQTGLRKVRILLVDDHSQLRRQLAARLSREPDFDLIAFAANSKQILDAIKTNEPDLILIDPIMRDGLGLATLRQVRNQLPYVVVIVLTAVVDTSLRLELREMGIKHILAKDLLFSQLVTELRSATNILPHSLDG